MVGFLKSKRPARNDAILVVDDDSCLVETMENWLTRRGHKVITASNGQEGLEVTIDQKPRLIVLDLKMPTMDGHEMLDRLRAAPDISEIPVIVCSNSSDITDITRAASNRVSGYITKPFYPPDLMGEIESVLQD